MNVNLQPSLRTTLLVALALVALAVFITILGYADPDACLYHWNLTNGLTDCAGNPLLP